VKKIILVIMLVCMASTVYADNSVRIKELQAEGQQSMQLLNKCQVRISEINGALQELTKQDEVIEEK